MLRWLSSLTCASNVEPRRRGSPATLRAQTRLPRRRLLLEVLDDVSTGAYSALERRYLRDVERAHALPTGARQSREVVVAAGGRVVFRDVEHAE